MAGTSELSIWRGALLEAGCNDIASTTDGSLEAKTCRVLWDSVRQSVLRDFDWSFARYEASLAELDETHSGWDYTYIIPNDCLRVLYIYNGHNDGGSVRQADMQSKFEVRLGEAKTSQVLLCNESPCTIIYTADVTTASIFDVSFADACKLYMASKLAWSLKRNEKVSEKAYVLYEKRIAHAKSLSANESVETYTRISKYETL